jgi:hypothetical protein
LARPATRLASLRLPITDGLRKAKKDARRIANLLRAPDAPEAKRVSLLRKIALLNDWRAHAGLLSHCWPEEFSESGSLQPAQPEPSLQINYGPGVQDMLEQGGQIAKQLANLQLGRKIDPRQKHSKTESKAAKRRHRKRSSPQLKSPAALQKGMEVLTAGLKAQAA